MQANGEWQELVKDIEVTAQPPGLWTVVKDYISGPVDVWIVANGTWFYAEDKSCGPDGDLRALIGRSRCLCPSAPVAALIGKVGGSSAGTDDGFVFIVGSNCVAHIDGRGPLYLTINDELTGMGNNRDALKVTVMIRPSAAPPSAAK
jgi:hypothetical protein